MYELDHPCFPHAHVLAAYVYHNICTLYHVEVDVIAFQRLFIIPRTLVPDLSTSTFGGQSYGIPLPRDERGTIVSAELNLKFVNTCVGQTLFDEPSNFRRGLGAWTT